MSKLTSPITDAQIENAIRSIKRSQRTFGFWLYYVRLDLLASKLYKVGITSKKSPTDRYKAWRACADTKEVGLWAFSEFDKERAKRAEMAILRAFEHQKVRKHEAYRLPKEIPWTECFKVDIWRSHGFVEGEAFEGFGLFTAILEVHKGKQILPRVAN